MVAPTNPILRGVPGKAVAAGAIDARERAPVDSRELLHDQAAAAAVVDAGQAEAVAAQAAADGGLLPTEAPLQGIGEMAQAPAPAAPETTPPTATTPPPVAEEAAPVSPWVIGGGALLGVGALVALANSDDDNDNPAPPPAEVPPPVEVPPPAPPANVAPTSGATVPVVTEVDGTTSLSPANFPFADTDAGDTLTTVRITGITPTPVDLTANPALQVDPVSNHGYELVSADVTWEQARDLAVARGGYLAVLDTPAEMAQVNDWYLLSADASGTTGTWIGASQAADAATPDAGWSWINNTPLAADPASALWNNLAPFEEPNDGAGTGETGLENFAAIYEGSGSNLIYDAGTGITATQSGFLIEYDTAAVSPLTLNGAAVTTGQVIAADQLANLSWNSVFNTGGTVTFQVGDNDGAYSADNTLTFTNPPAVTVTPPTTIAIEDQHLNVLA